MRSFGAGPIVQRKCACGGDCPRCAAKTDKLNVQTKLAISSPGDVFESEADAVADHVMRMPDLASQGQRTTAATDRTAADQLGKAIDALAESPLSATTAASLKANFNWSSGNSPADLRP